MASNSDVTIVEELQDMSEIDQEAASPASLAASESSVKDPSVPVRIKYEMFYQLPPKGSKKFIAKCKLCHNPYRFTVNSKGNLLKHLQLKHPKNLDNHKNEQLKQLPASQQTLHRDGTLIKAG